MSLGYLYNVQKSPDRRQQNLPYFGERRSGIDRRQTERILLNPQVKQDLKVAKKLLEEYTPDVFVKSETNKAATFVSKPEKTKNIEALSSTNNLDTFVKTENIKETNKHKAKDDFMLEATFSTVGAGLGLVLPMLVGIANPLAIAGLSAAGLAMGVALGSKAVDYYNGINPNKK